MNTGVIATRYARALYKYVTSTGHEEQVYAQVTGLLQDPPVIPDPLHEDLQKFVALVIGRGRRELLREMLSGFVQLYRRERNIRVARLTMAVPSPELEERLARMLRERTGCTLEMVSKVDPSLVGGFVLKVDDLMLDASVKRQLELVRRQFIQKNKRIV